MQLFKKKQEAEEDLEKFRDITDDVLEADFVPYACHWDNNSIITKNGEVLQTIKITGFLHDTPEGQSNDSSLRAKIRETIMGCVDSTKYAVWVHTIRRRTNLKTTGEYKRDFSGYLNHFWNDKNDWEHKFTNEIYITLVRDGKDVEIARDPLQLLRSVMPSFNNRYFESYADACSKELHIVTEKMLSMLSNFGAKLLGIEERDGICYSEPCAFLGKLATLRDFDFPVTDMNISHLITDYDVTFGYNAMEVRMRSDNTRRFGAILTMKEYRELDVGALDIILQIPAEFIISQSFEFIPAKLALQGYERQKNIFDTSQAQSLYERTGLKQIIEDNKGNKTDFGQSQINFFLLADSIKTLETGVANAAKAFAALGMTTMREDIKLEECYWAQMPANFAFVRRMNPISTARIGGFANLTELPAGSDKNPWGAAVTTFYTAAHTPYFFNFHKDNNGHTMIIGHNETGRTALLNFLLSEARKFDNKLFLFDVNRSSEIFLRSLGGVYYNPYPRAEARTYAQLSLNPFEMEDTQDTRDFLSWWMMSLVSPRSESTLFEICGKAVSQVMGLPKEQRNLRNCIETMHSIDAASAGLFAPWLQGELGELFGGRDSLVLDNALCGFELGNVLRHEVAIAPVVSYLLQRIKAVLDGKPAIIVLNEAWKMLDNPVLAPHITELLDTLKQKNAIAVFAASPFEQNQQTNITNVVISNIATHMYLANSDADVTYETTFGLTSVEVSYLALMNTEDRHFLVKQGDQSVILELNLNGMNDIIAVLESTPANLAVMEEMITKNGLTHQKWMPAFLEMV